MIVFREYLLEALMRASGRTATGRETAQRHVEKYIKPFLSGGERGAEKNTHVLGKAHEGLSAGTSLTIKGHEVIGSKHHAIVSANGRTYKIPISKIHKPKVGYSEEHAIAHLWNNINHGRRTGDLRRDATPQQLQSHIKNNIMKNKKHPLHFHNIGSEGFYGGIKTQGSKKVYYDQLLKAAHTVHAIAKHPSNNSNVVDLHNTSMSVVGKGKHNVVGSSYSTRGRGVVGKTDLVLKHGNRIKMKMSLKREGGSQYASSYPSEMRGMLGNTIDHLKNTKKISSSKAAMLHRHADTLHKVMSKGDPNHIPKANRLLAGIVNSHPDFHAHLAREAITGESKFGAKSKGVPNFLITHGKNAKVTHIDSINYSQIAKPKISLGKEGKTQMPHVARFRETGRPLKEEVWDTPSPSKKSKGLTPKQKAMAKARAASHNRPYPNLIDNMWASQQ